MPPIPPITWMIFFAIIGMAVLLVYREHGPRKAVATGMLLSLLVPEWVRWEVSPEVWINLRVASCVFGLCLYLVHRQSTFNFSLNPCDFAVLGLVGTPIISDCITTGPHWSIPLRAYGEWLLPYLAGRMALQQVGDARWLLPLTVWVTLILTLFGVVEMFLPERNLFEMLVLEQRPYDARALWEMQRFGLQRAYGPTNHPIYFGVLMFLLYPWMVYAASRAAKNKGVWWWKFMPYVCMLGVCTSLSRSPMLAIPLAIYITWLIQKPTWRPMLIGSGIAGLVLLLSTWNMVVYQMERFSREANSKKMVKIHGREYRFTGTSHRWLMFVAYAPALQRTGLLGFGTDRMKDFPPEVPGSNGIPYEMHSVDNSFLLFTLRFGFLGLLGFSALVFIAPWSYLRLGWEPKAEGAVWLIAMTSTLISMAFIILTVWFPQDYSFFYIWCLGGAGGLWAERESPLVEAAESPQENARSQSRRRRRKRSQSGDDPNDTDSSTASTTPPAVTPKIAEEPDEMEQRRSRRRSREKRSNE